MDANDFDTLSRALSEAGSRRGLLGLLTGAALGGLLTRLDLENAMAKRKRHGRRRSHRPGKDKDNRKGKRKGGSRVGTQDCPDGFVACFLLNDDGTCSFVTEFDPIGNCYEFGTGCCPCAHRDKAYWNEQCNTIAPEGCNGKCEAHHTAGSFNCFTCGGEIL
jgi:hypothetical protein